MNPVEAELRDLRHRLRTDRQGALDEFSTRYGDALSRVIGRMLRTHRSVRHRLRLAGDENAEVASELVRQVGIAILGLSGEFEPRFTDTVRATREETTRLART